MLYAKNDDCDWWKILIYNDNEKHILNLHKNGVSTIEHNHDHTFIFFFCSKEEQCIKT